MIYWCFFLPGMTLFLIWFLSLQGLFGGSAGSSWCLFWSWHSRWTRAFHLSWWFGCQRVHLLVILCSPQEGKIFGLRSPMFFLYHNSDRAAVVGVFLLFTWMGSFSPFYVPKNIHFLFFDVTSLIKLRNNIKLLCGFLSNSIISCQSWVCSLPFATELLFGHAANLRMPHKKIGTFRGTCVYCAIFIGILWCTLEPLRPMHTEMNTLWARTQSWTENCLIMIRWLCSGARPGLRKNKLIENVIF